MKPLLLIVNMAMLTLTFVSTEATAQGWGRGWGRGVGQGRGMGRGLEPGFRCWSMASLDLSEKQRQQINKLEAETDEKLAPRWNELEAKQDEIQTLRANPKQDRDTIVALETEIDALRSRIHRKNRDLRFAVSNILNLEQRARYAQCGRGRWGRGFGLGRGRGWGRGFGLGRGRGWGRGLGMDSGRRCRGGCGYGYGYGRNRW